MFIYNSNFDILNFIISSRRSFRHLQLWNKSIISRYKGGSKNVTYRYIDRHILTGDFKDWEHTLLALSAGEFVKRFV